MTDTQIEPTEPLEPEIIEEKSPSYASSMEEILALIRGRAPLIWILTHEEGRFINDFADSIATPCKRDLWLWSAYQGLVRQDQSSSIERATGEEEGKNDILVNITT